MEETQLATAQTPTQITQRATASQRPNALRRTEALSNLGAPDSPAAAAVAETDGLETQLDETQVDGETQDESQDARPSAAQPPTVSPRADAFALLRAGAARDAEPVVTRPSKLRLANAFIDTEANLSDEEGERPFGGVSDDENEDDHDRELAELVDNTAEDEAIVAEQDEEAAKLHRYEHALSEQETQVLTSSRTSARTKRRGKPKISPAPSGLRQEKSATSVAGTLFPTTTLMTITFESVTARSAPGSL